jgi:hypothetical protein
MAAEINDDAKPYKWEEVDPPAPPAPEVLQLWTEVGNGLDKNQTGACLASALPLVSHLSRGTDCTAAYVDFSRDSGIQNVEGMKVVFIMKDLLRLNKYCTAFY